MDLPLYLAVVVGAVLRRASTSASGSGMFSSVFASGDKVKFPSCKRVQDKLVWSVWMKINEDILGTCRDLGRE